MAEDLKQKLIETIGKNIENARKAVGWTQSELAERTGCVSRSTIGKIESGNATNVAASTISVVAATLGVPPYMLMLDPCDWRGLVKLIDKGEALKHYMRARGRVSEEDVERIETMAGASAKRQRRMAVAETYALVARVFGIEDKDWNGMPDEDRKSRTAVTGLATGMIPDVPVVNGVVANVIVG